MKRHKNHHYWTADEKAKFIEAVKIYGKDYKRITKHVGLLDVDIIRRRCANELLKYRNRPHLPEAKIMIEKLSVKLKGGRPTILETELMSQMA